jgi:hypothetical protein
LGVSGLCYALTNSGGILVSANGGAKWTQQVQFDGFGVVDAVSCAGTAGSFRTNYQCVAVGDLAAIVSETVTFIRIGTGQLMPTSGTSQVGIPTTFTLTWTDPNGWHDLQNLDLQLSNPSTGIALWARFTVGAGSNPSTFSLLDANGNLVGEGLPGSPGTLDTSTASLDLAHSSFQGSGPTGPSVTVTYVVSLKGPAAGRVYATELTATDVAGEVQGPQSVGTWAVGPFHLMLPRVYR